MKSQKYILVLIFLALLFVPYSAFGQYEQDIDSGVHPADFERVGMSGWQFLKIPTDARSAALGGITTALSHGDASFAMTNPASTADVENLSLFFSQMTWIADISCNSGSVVKNFGSWGHLGLNFTFIDYGTMYRTKNLEEVDGRGRRTGNVIPLLDEGTFSGGDLAIGVSYSRNVSDRLQVGGTMRYIEEQLDDVEGAKTWNWSFDIGTVYYTGIKTWRLAMVGRNFGPDVEFSEYSERIQWPPIQVRMPMMFALGTAIDVLEGKGDNPHLLTIAGEFIHPNDGPEKLNFGAEYSFMNLLMLRGGYRYNYDEMGLTLGAGLRVTTFSHTIKVNYALIDFGRFDQVHMFTIGLERD